MADWSPICISDGEDDEDTEQQGQGVTQGQEVKEESHRVTPPSHPVPSDVVNQVCTTHQIPYYSTAKPQHYSHVSDNASNLPTSSSTNANFQFPTVSSMENRTESSMVNPPGSSTMNTAASSTVNPAGPMPTSNLSQAQLWDMFGMWCNSQGYRVPDSMPPFFTAPTGYPGNANPGYHGNNGGYAPAAAQVVHQVNLPPTPPSVDADLMLGQQPQGQIRQEPRPEGHIQHEDLGLLLQGRVSMSPISFPPHVSSSGQDASHQSLTSVRPSASCGAPPLGGSTLPAPSSEHSQSSTSGHVTNLTDTTDVKPHVIEPIVIEPVAPPCGKDTGLCPHIKTEPGLMDGTGQCDSPHFRTDVAPPVNYDSNNSSPNTPVLSPGGTSVQPTPVSVTMRTSLANGPITSLNPSMTSAGPTVTSYHMTKMLLGAAPVTSFPKSMTLPVTASMTSYNSAETLPVTTHMTSSVIRNPGTGEKCFFCVKCLTFFSRKEYLMAHTCVLEADGVTYNVRGDMSDIVDATCPVCGLWTVTQELLAEHMSELHLPQSSSGVSKLYSCKLCKCYFSGKGSAESHVFLYHSRPIHEVILVLRDMLPPNNVMLPPNNVMLPPNTVTLPSNNVMFPSNKVTLQSNNVMLPPKGVVLNNVTLPSNNVMLPSNNVMLPPKGVVMNNVMLPPKGGVLRNVRLTLRNVVQNKASPSSIGANQDHVMLPTNNVSSLSAIPDITTAPTAVSADSESSSKQSSKAMPRLLPLDSNRRYTCVPCGFKFIVEGILRVHLTSRHGVTKQEAERLISVSDGHVTSLYLDIFGGSSTGSGNSTLPAANAVTATTPLTSSNVSPTSSVGSVITSGVPMTSATTLATSMTSQTSPVTSALSPVAGVEGMSPGVFDRLRDSLSDNSSAPEPPRKMRRLNPIGSLKMVALPRVEEKREDAGGEMDTESPTEGKVEPESPSEGKMEAESLSEGKMEAESPPRAGLTDGDDPVAESPRDGGDVLTRQFPCDLCPAAFQSAQRLASHKVTHVRIDAVTGRDKPFYCKMCATFYPTVGSYCQHKALDRDPEGNYLCDLCGRVKENMKTFNSHMYNCHSNRTKPAVMKQLAVQNPVDATTSPVVPGEFKCEVCGASFVKITGLIKHRTCHDPIDAATQRRKPIYCELCDTYHRTRASYLAHKKKSPIHRMFAKNRQSKSSQKMQNSSDREKNVTPRDTSEISSIETCGTSGISPIETRGSGEISSNETRDTSEISPIETRDTSEISPIETRNTGEISSSETQDTGEISSKPRDNTEEFTKTTVYRCSVCKSGFLSKTALNNHRSFHEPLDPVTGQLKPHQCEECHKYFRTHTSYSSHVQNMHQSWASDLSTSRDMLNQSHDQSMTSQVSHDQSVTSQESHDQSTTSQMSHDPSVTSARDADVQDNEISFSESRDTTLTETSASMGERAEGGGKIFTCKVCHRQISFIQNFIAHKRSHNPRDIKTGKLRTYKCDVCKTYHSTQKSLLHHRARYHPGVMVGSEVSSGEAMSSASPRPSASSFLLSPSPRRPRSHGSHRSHRPHPGLMSSRKHSHHAAAGSRPRHLVYTTHPPGGVPRTAHKHEAFRRTAHRCERCKRKFGSREKLERHVDQHEWIDAKTGFSKPFGCAVCWLYYHSYNNYRLHLRSVHGPPE